MKIGCWEVPKPTDPSLLWLAEWKVPAPLEKFEKLRPEKFCAHSGPPYPFYYFQKLLRMQNILYCLKFIWKCDVPMRSVGCPPGVNSNLILVAICLRPVHLLATLNGYTSNCDIQFTFSSNTHVHSLPIYCSLFQIYRVFFYRYFPKSYKF